MSRASGRSPRTRIQAVAAVLLVHAAALVLIVVERNKSQDRPVLELQYVSLWPQVQMLPEKVGKPHRPEEFTHITVQAVQVPSERPTLPEKELLGPLGSAGAAVKSGNPSVDWRAAAMGAAARVAQAGSEQKEFSAAPRGQREACRPRVFDEETKRLMEEKLPTPADPDLVAENPTANCIIVGGYPKCVQKITGKPRHRESFADQVGERRVGRKGAGSVPSPNTCE
jgi:hypothetical protein